MARLLAMHGTASPMFSVAKEGFQEVVFTTAWGVYWPSNELIPKVRTPRPQPIESSEGRSQILYVGNRSYA